MTSVHSPVALQVIAAQIATCIECATLRYVLAMVDDGVPLAQIADALARYIETIDRWCDHDLPAQVRLGLGHTSAQAPVAVIDQPLGLVDHRDDA
jgi:hypothetical protein